MRPLSVKAGASVGGIGQPFQDTRGNHPPLVWAVQPQNLQWDAGGHGVVMLTALTWQLAGPGGTPMPHGMCPLSHRPHSRMKQLTPTRLQG